MSNVIQDPKDMFFPFFCAPYGSARKDYQRYKLEMLKAARDAMETRLAAIDAAIATIERQTADLESTEAS
ncbi:MAG: hypothetical protein WBB01_18300 [Phormidesmis sp.]